MKRGHHQTELFRLVSTIAEPFTKYTCWQAFQCQCSIKTVESCIRRWRLNHWIRAERLHGPGDKTTTEYTRWSWPDKILVRNKPKVKRDRPVKISPYEAQWRELRETMTVPQVYWESDHSTVGTVLQNNYKLGKAGAKAQSSPPFDGTHPH
jgi:hypothetical protein